MVIAKISKYMCLHAVMKIHACVKIDVCMHDAHLHAPKPQNRNVKKKNPICTQDTFYH